jgi:Domain of unknown function (DUF4190)
VLCSNGHNNADTARFCSTCGTNTFQPSSTGEIVVTQMQMVKQTTTNGLAIAAMVLGIVWVYWVGSILALIFGYIARRQIKQRGQNGDGMAIAGIVLGWVGIASLIVIIIVAIVAAP